MLLPFSNRLLLLKFPKLRDYKTAENELRGRFYFYTELVKSLDSETRGVVMVNYSVGQFRDTSVHGLVENIKLTFGRYLYLCISIVLFQISLLTSFPSYL